MKIAVLSALMAYMLPIGGFAAKSISSEIKEYRRLCQIAADNPGVFKTFKSTASYQQILEHVDGQTGKKYLDIICQNYPELISLFDRFRTNDQLGAPQQVDYGKYGWFSPTTLRYVKVAGDLQKLFGSLDGLRILEIGGGYGGQCKVLSELTNFQSYTIIDLPECNALSKKYLDAYGIKNVRVIDPEHLNELDEEYDIVISNYAFSELDADTQKEYMDTVIVKANSGYMTCNQINHLFGLSSLSLQEWVDKLQSHQKTVQIQEENPLTSPNGVLVTWISNYTERDSRIGFRRD